MYNIFTFWMSVTEHMPLTFSIFSETELNSVNYENVYSGVTFALCIGDQDQVQTYSNSPCCNTKFSIFMNCLSYALILLALLALLVL